MQEEVELYIHIPFCVKKCNYCDFLSFSADDSVQEAYATQIINELTYRSGLASGYTVSSCFIGGGTPSVISEWHIYDIMETVSEYYKLAADAEITIECNPSSVLRHKLAVYRKAGINRLSIGVQSADNAELKMLGRVHTFEEFLKTYQSARMEGFDNINIDLMNCFPMQSLRTWRKTLRNVCMLKPEHISVYNLIIEEGTPFYRMREKGLLMMPSEEEQEAIDSFTKTCLARYGYRRYEFSNYSREGRACRHNIGYWTGTPYIGFGLGASSYFGGCRWKNIEDIREYFSIDFSKACPANDDGEEQAAHAGDTDAGGIRAKLPGGSDSAIEKRLRTDVEYLSPEDRMEEFVYLGMRLTSGISVNRFETLFGTSIDEVYGEVLDKYAALGLIEREGDILRLTDRGIDVSNVVLSDFLLD